VLQLTQSPASFVHPVQCQENPCGLLDKQSNIWIDLISSKFNFRKLSIHQLPTLIYFHVLAQQAHLRPQHQGIKSHVDRAIAQAVSRPILTAATRVRA
jgi:hypothetical protein